MFLITTIHSNNMLRNIKQHYKLFCTSKNNWKWITQEATHIKFTNGRSYLKNQILFESHTCHYVTTFIEKLVCQSLKVTALHSITSTASHRTLLMTGFTNKNNHHSKLEESVSQVLRWLALQRKVAQVMKQLNTMIESTFTSVWTKRAQIHSSSLTLM